MRFDLPAEAFPRAILDFYRQSHVLVLFSSMRDLHSIKTQPVSGELLPREALKRMLKGTPLTFVFDSPRSAIIRRADSAAGSAAARGVARRPPSPPAPAAHDLVLVQSPPVTPVSARVDEVLVTGSLIHGGVDVSAPLITVTSKQLTQASYPTVQDSLYQLPINSLNAPREDLGLYGNDSWGTGIDLRGLGVGATLVLVNGQRQPLGGYSGSFVDVSNIPASMVERIEVFADGASALYGSDAIAGVVNIILRDDFQGAETQAYYGGAPGGRDELMASQLFGTHWSSGRALIGYEYLDATPLDASARSYAADADKTPFGGADYRSFYASPGNLLNPATSQPLSSHPLLENPFAQAQLFPEERQHSLYASATQELSDSVELFGNARFSQRGTLSQELPFQEILSVPSTNPFYVNPGVGSGEALVAYSFLSTLGPGALAAETRDYDGTLGAHLQLGELWRATLTESVGLETLLANTYNQPDQAALAAALNDPDPATAFDPFGPTSAATIASIRGYALAHVASSVGTTSLVADGPILPAPGGPLRLAVGVEHRQEALSQDVPEAADPDADPDLDQDVTSQRYSRSIDAAFSELSIPLVGHPALPAEPPRLELTVAGRYERYSDFGHTFNPTTRLAWTVSRWLKLRGSWGRSFRAPTLDDLHDSAANITGLAVLRDPQSPTGSSLVLVEQGDNPDLKQETATTWTGGFDLTPLSGSQLSLTYYAIDYRNQIATPAAADPFDVLVNASEWSSVITRNPTPQQIATACNAPGLFEGSRQVCAASAPTAIVDLQLANLASTKMSGVDLQAHQRIDTGLGPLGFGLSGAYILYFDQAATATSPAFNMLDQVGYPLAVRLRATMDWSERGGDQPGFGLDLAFSYTGSYHDPESLLLPEVSSYSTADVQLSYRTSAQGWWSHMELSLNAVNVLNRDPPFVDDEYGYDRFNTQPLGRVLSVNLRKTW